jgi:hypothetical protein
MENGQTLNGTVGTPHWEIGQDTCANGYCDNSTSTINEVYLDSMAARFDVATTWPASPSREAAKLGSKQFAESLDFNVAPGVTVNQNNGYTGYKVACVRNNGLFTFNARLWDVTWRGAPDDGTDKTMRVGLEMIDTAATPDHTATDNDSPHGNYHHYVMYNGNKYSVLRKGNW